MYRYRLEYLKDFSSHGRLLEEHKRLVEAIAGRDKQKAVDIIKAHIYNQEISVIKTISQAGNE